MTHADKRRRAEEYAWELSQWHILPVEDYVSKIADSLACYGSELEAAAIDRCKDAVKATLDNCTHPECIATRKKKGYSTCAGGHLARDAVNAIAKLREQK